MISLFHSEYLDVWLLNSSVCGKGNMMQFGNSASSRRNSARNGLIIFCFSSATACIFTAAHMYFPISKVLFYLTNKILSIGI